MVELTGIEPVASSLRTK